MSNSTENSHCNEEEHIYVKGIFNLKNELKQTNLGDCYCHPSAITPLHPKYQHQGRVISSSRADPGGGCKCIGCAPHLAL